VTDDRPSSTNLRLDFLKVLKLLSLNRSRATSEPLKLVVAVRIRRLSRLLPVERFACSVAHPVGIVFFRLASRKATQVMLKVLNRVVVGREILLVLSFEHSFHRILPVPESWALAQEMERRLANLGDRRFWCISRETWRARPVHLDAALACNNSDSRFRRSLL
jgi:hypothetical protein